MSFVKTHPTPPSERKALICLSHIFLQKFCEVIETHCDDNLRKSDIPRTDFTTS